MSFWLKCSSGIADWSLNLASWFLQSKKMPPQKKTKHILAKIGQILLYAEFCGHARAEVLEDWFFSISPESKFHGVLPKKSSRSDQAFRVIC